MALEPARLDTNGAACHGPFGPVRGHGHAAAWHSLSAWRLQEGV